MSRVVPVHESRVQVQRTGDGLRVDFQRRRPWWRFALPAWALFVVGLGLVSMLASDAPGNGPGVGFLVLWSTFGLAIVGLSLGGLLWRESLLLDTRTLTRTVRLGPVERERSFARERIEDLRVSPESMSPFDMRAGLRVYGIGGGTVAFDYGDRTYRLADVEEAEAKRVVAALAAEGLGG